MADIEYQKRVWLNKQMPSNVEHDDFDAAIHVLFDDTQLADAPAKTIGYILEDETEMRAVSAVVQAIDHLLKTHGTELTDAQYIATPEWNTIVAAAKTALSVLAKKPVAGD